MERLKLFLIASFFVGSFVPSDYYYRKEEICGIDRIITHEWEMYLFPKDSLRLYHKVSDSKSLKIFTDVYMGTWERQDKRITIKIKNEGLKKESIYTFISYGDSIRLNGFGLEVPSFLVLKK